MRFSFHNLDDQEFENLVGQIFMEILGMGTVVFTKGRDGGRDGRFSGTANNFPSKNSPAIGKFIIQARHTANPYASCSDSSFETIIKNEIPRIKNLDHPPAVSHRQGPCFSVLHIYVYPCRRLKICGWESRYL